jgi:cytochrome c-type biogenesis protein CcmH
VKSALAAWVDLAAEAPADADWLPLVRQRIAEAAGAVGIDPGTLKGATGGPADAAVAAAAKGAASTSAEARQAMILAMVGKLASRLESQPDDVEGWARLGRSYMVLNQPDKAREAYARAVKLKPNDAQLSQALAEASAAASGQSSR